VLSQLPTFANAWRLQFLGDELMRLKPQLISCTLH